MPSTPKEGEMWPQELQILPRYMIIPSERDSKVCTVEIKYYNSSSKNPKYSTVDVRKLSLIPDLKN